MLGKEKVIRRNISVNEFNVNSKIKGRILSKHSMKKYGFVEYEDKWVNEIVVSEKFKILFRIELYKDNPRDRVNIEVIDMVYNFVYDYQKYMARPSRNEVPVMVYNKVEKILEELQKIKIISGHIKGEYV